ncbi:protein spdB [Streptomyces sp. NPDC085942]|uniref:protein spdB n=1 Tax=Streptomyces sp. NPDC085942 TaxID=3365743 RepID=UPI0037D8F388
MRSTVAKTVLPAVAMTAVSMVLTLAVVVMWLGTAMPWPIALVVGLGIDGGWLATLAYERRLAAQGDHSAPVTAVGWSFGLVATGVLVAHALTAEESAGAWLAVAWLPVAAKALWLVHGLWERTALTGEALDAIQGIQQEARDEAAVARARLRAEAATEETRLTAVTQAGARVAHVQAKTADALSRAWSTLESAREGEGTGRALTSVTARVTPGVTPRWELPVWGPTEPVSGFALESAGALTDEALDVLVDKIRHSETPALSYREMASRFRTAGHSASEVRLRAAWKRVVAA